ncbi:MAG TPA: carbohydrate kinase family protein [Candidatus Saccharimonadales bacterium]|nr:carbohydrate kinase family protein [Candidatus Saccharimonadales bacterium]
MAAAVQERLVVAGVGAGSLDYFLPFPGDVRPGSDEPWELWPGHIPGEKGILEPHQVGFLETATGLETHVGGNTVNSLAWIAMQGSVKQARLVTAVGIEGDVASDAILKHLPNVGVSGEHVLRLPGYQPSIAAIEHEFEGSNRMVRSRRRGPMGEHMTDGHLMKAMHGANVVLMASLKDTDLMDRVFTLAPTEAFTTLNPSQTELDDEQDRRHILSSLGDRNVSLLAVNEKELPKLLGRRDEDPLKLAKDASKRYAKYVLCTLGEAGLVIAHNGDSKWHPTVHVPKEEIGTTLGAGDRAHAIAALRIAERVPLEDVVCEIAHSTSNLVRYRGAHQDQYDSTVKRLKRHSF